MGERGRPPEPLEIKRRRARYQGTDSGGRKLPQPSNVVALPMADGIPDPPGELLLPGRDLWELIWTAGATWISPATDIEEVAEVCRLTDDLVRARDRYRATSNPADARVVLAVSERRSSLLANIGFNPTARSRLGVAEVKRVSALDKLLERHAGSS